MGKNKFIIPIISLTLIFLISLTTNISNNTYLMANWNNLSQDSEISILNWEANGLAISTATSIQENPQICSDGAGGAIITWQDYRNGPRRDIYAQNVDGSGIVNWTANGVQICNEAEDQFNLQICSDGAGGAIITWQDYRSGSNFTIYAQKINSSGNIQWTANGVTICTAGHNQVKPQICSDGTGGAIIAWWDYRNSNKADIYAQRINSSGSVQWTASGVAVCTENNSQDLPHICSDGSGGAIIAWQDLRNGSYTDIYVQKINATGMPQWDNNGTAICTLDNNQQNPKICSDGAGGAIVTWQHFKLGFSNDIYAQKINSSGSIKWTINGTVICNNTSVQNSPEICSDGAEGAIITWQDGRPISGDYDIYAQRINSSEAIIWTTNGEAICTATNYQYEPKICNDTEGGAIITWYDYRAGADYDIYAQRVNSSGAVNWTINGIAVCTASGDQMFQQVCSDGSVGAIIVWQDDRTGVSNRDIYAQKELTTFAGAPDNSGVIGLLIITMQQPQTLGITITIVVVVIAAVAVIIVVFYMKKK